MSRRGKADKTVPRRVIVIGGGISGLSAGWRLAQRGVEVVILEAAPALGGLAGSVKEGPYRMDLGPHSFFSADEAILGDVLGLFGGAPAPRPRSVKFFYEGKYIDYPLTLRGVLFQMGLRSGIRSALSLAKGKLTRRRGAGGSEDETIEDWAVGSFGEHLYRTFFKPYTEQFWKIPCSELSARAIPTNTRMSFANTLRLLLHRRRDRRGESLVEREMLPTYYPDGGFVEIAERIAAVVEGRGGRIRRNSEVTGVRCLPDDTMVVTLRSPGGEKTLQADHVVSTLPLPLLAGMLEPAPPPEVLRSAARLDYRSLVVLGMLTCKQNVLGCGYTYVLNRPYNRIFEMNEFSPGTSPPGENIVGVEIPCLNNSAAWGAPKEELFDICIGSLAEDGFLAPGDVQQLFLARAAHAYPIYRKDYAGHLERVMNHIDGIAALSTLGRCGEFRYMDIDECIGRAFDLVESRICRSRE